MLHGGPDVHRVERKRRRHFELVSPSRSPPQGARESGAATTSGTIRLQAHSGRSGNLKPRATGCGCR